MKKFFSLMCAIAIVFSANAVPAKVLGMSKQVEAAQVKTVKAHKALPATRLLKAERAAVAFKAPQAKHEDYTVDIVEYTEKYYASGSDVWVKLYDEDGTLYAFDVVVAEGTEELALDSAYVLSSMLVNYTYMLDTNSVKTKFASASLTKSLVPYEEQQLVHFDASFSDSLGNNYTLTYQEAPFIITGDTIDVVFVGNANKPIYSQGLCQLRAADDDYDIAFTFPCAEGAPAGVYGEEDMNLQYTFVNDLEAKGAHCVVVESNGTISLEGWILAKDGNVYHVTFSFTAPTVQSYETITATNLVLDESLASWFGIIVAEASNEDYTVSMYLPAENYFGTFSADEVSLSIEGADDNKVEIYEGTITVANTATGVAITGTVLSADGVQYTLNLTYVIPDATSQETITMSGKLTDIQGQAWQFIGSTANEMVTIAAYATSIPGTYGRSDLVADYTYVMKVVGSDTLYYDMVDANIVVAVNGTNATITGTLKGQNYYDSSDVIEFTLNLTATVEESGSGGGEGSQYDNSEYDFIETFSTYDVDNQYLAQYGDLIVTATNANGASVGLDMYIGDGESTLTPGEYTISDSEEPMTIYPGSCNGTNVYYSFFGYTNSEGYITDMWFPVSGSVIVSESGVISIDALNSYGKRIFVRLGEWPEGIENADAKAGAVKAIRNGQLIIIKNGVEFNAQGAIVK